MKVDGGSNEGFEWEQKGQTWASGRCGFAM